MARTTRRSLLLLAVISAFAAAPHLTFGLLADTCNARSDFQYISPQNYYQIGDTVRIEIVLGAGLITGRNPGHDRPCPVRARLHSLGVPCPDAGNLISYAGNISSNCAGISWSANSAGGPAPNEVVFSATPGVVIPAGQGTFCSIQFDVHVDNFPPTGLVIRQASGFTIPALDAVCNTPGLLSAGNQSTGSLNICNCDDGNACTTEVCDSQLGCIYTPVVCNDNNACTTDTCDPAIGCVYTPNPPCNDNNACTTDTCDPAIGCVYTPNPPCNDSNACTTDTCDPAIGCVYTPNPPCNDSNACTTDTCDPAIGCVYTPNPPCNDGNACTTDTCDPAIGCVYTPNPPCNDGNACTTDTCDPAIGCVYTPNPPCNDSNACTTDTCDPAIGCVYTPNLPCNDSNACTTDTCDPAIGCVYTPNPPCNDSNACTTDTCDPAIGCVYTPNPPCNDGDACTTDTCVPAIGCVYTPNPPCNDSDACTTDTCDPAIGCVYTPNPPCDDQNACTTDTCDPVMGCVYTPNPPCDDGDACTTDTCVPATGCVYTPNAPCDDGDVCTDDTCDPATGCVYTPNDQCNFICRTPGYWATHSSTAKSACSDVTGAVIEMGGGSLNICGECLTNNGSDHTLAPGDAASAVEAMCVAVKGQQARQLARQLTAAALNCIISNAGADCLDGPTGEVFSLCNQGCAVAVGNAPGPAPAGFNMGWCISAIDCYNNGFGLPTEAGCGASTGCHDRALPWDMIPRPANCNGPAPASSERCQAAKDTGCGILPFDETKCASDSCP